MPKEVFDIKTERRENERMLAEERDKAVFHSQSMAESFVTMKQRLLLHPPNLKEPSLSTPSSAQVIVLQGF
ncbi:hypothetical protein CEXT_715951 [Caerostris extrusa]|uniref:Uncharacterized protein n=1 Tax=Caerostris extrusa TaxID=172846 RepID=A0AAV4NXC8_CAEEX|nr:hypothetical protein CEXT_715951 [Caerostris extrusa]